MAKRRPGSSADVTLRAIEKLPLLRMPARHPLLPELDVARPYLEKILLKTYERAKA